MAPGARIKFCAPMFEPEVFRKQLYWIEESTCDIVGTFRCSLSRTPHSDSVPPQWFGTPIVIRRPGNCAPLSPCTRGQWGTFIRSRSNPVATEGFGGLSPSKQSSKPTKFGEETLYISGVFFQFSEVRPHLHKRKAPYWWLSGHGSSHVSLLLLFMDKIRGKDKTSLHCSQGCRYSMEKNVNCWQHRACWAGMFLWL